jgi:hypothetical protein
MRTAALITLLCLLGPAAVAAPLGDGVILPLKQGMLLMDQCSRSVPQWDEFWSPDAAQIADLESGFDQAVAAQLKTRGEVAPPTGFDRQYIGIVVAGVRRIYVNAFLHELDDGKGKQVTFPPKDFWRTNAVVVCDGGSYYFGAVYDPATKRFSDFAFNGVT